MDYISVGVIVAYLVISTAVGSMLARRTTSSTQWAVAGGGMSLIMIAVGIAGTRIGGAGTYGVAGNVMRGGVWYLWWYGINTFLALAIVGVFFAVPYRRLKLQTVGEIFTIRFRKRRGQALASFCVQTEYFIVNIIEAYIIGSIITSLTPVPMHISVFIAAAVLVSYTALGGLWGSAYTNLIHCIVILAGLSIVGVMGIEKLGGWASVTELVNGHLAGVDVDQGTWWGFAGVGGLAGWGAVLGMFFSASIHTPAASVYTNFSTAARSERILIPGFVLAGLIAMMMPFLAGLIGIVTLANYGYSRGFSTYTSITALPTEIHPWIGGLALAAILAAVISSGGPILLSSSTMFVRDWLPFTRNYTADRKLKAYRITTVVYGVIAAAFAWVVAQTTITVLDLLLFGFAMVVPPAIAIGYLIHWKRTTEQGAYWGMMAGYLGGLVWFILIKWALAAGLQVTDGSPWWRKIAYYCFAYEGEGIDPSYATTIIPLLVVPLISLMTREQEEDKGTFYEVVSGRREIEASV